MLKALLALVLAALCVAPALADPLPGDQEVTVSGGFGGLLHGALQIPPGWRSGPAVLMIPGSGNVDRDAAAPAQGFFGNDLRLLAQGLADGGIPSLRIDKRCIAQSAPACPGESHLTIGAYVDDAVAWAQFLGSRPGVTCVALLGHSEGALVAALAAARVQTCGLVSISGVGRPFYQVLEEQVRASGVPPALVTRVVEIDNELRAGGRVGNIPPQLMGLYRPSVQPYVISEFAVSPTNAIAAVKAPVLIMQGTTDLQVRVEDARALADARPGSELIILDGVNHILKVAPYERAANLATYADPNLPLAPGVVDPIISFIRASAALPRPPAPG
jgi:pimeloyl-ACP methyl ester carboxylesterase